MDPAQLYHYLQTLQIPAVIWPVVQPNMGISQPPIVVIQSLAQWPPATGVAMQAHTAPQGMAQEGYQHQYPYPRQMRFDPYQRAPSQGKRIIRRGTRGKGRKINYHGANTKSNFGVKKVAAHIPSSKPPAGDKCNEDKKGDVQVKNTDTK